MKHTSKTRNDDSEQCQTFYTGAPGNVTSGGGTREDMQAETLGRPVRRVAYKAVRSSRK
jgi:hypothetical protein